MAMSLYFFVAFLFPIPFTTFTPAIPTSSIAFGCFHLFLFLLFLSTVFLPFPRPLLFLLHHILLRCSLWFLGLYTLCRCLFLHIQGCSSNIFLFLTFLVVFSTGSLLCFLLWGGFEPSLDIVFFYS